MKLYIVTSCYPECLRDSEWKEVVSEVLYPGQVYTDLDRAKASCQEEVDGMWNEVENLNGKAPIMEWKKAGSNNYSLEATCEEVDVIFNIWTREVYYVPQTRDWPPAGS